VVSKHSLGQRGGALFSFFVGIFWATSLQIRYEIFGAKFAKKSSVWILYGKIRKFKSQIGRIGVRMREISLI